MAGVLFQHIETVDPPTSTSPNADFLPYYQVNTGTSALTFAGTLASQWWEAVIVAFKQGATA